MLRKIPVIVIIFLFISSLANGQAKRTALVKGKLINRSTHSPFNDLKVSIPGIGVFTRSDGDGNFEISEVPFGQHVLIVSGYNAKADTVTITVDKNVVELADIAVIPNNNPEQSETTEIPTIAIADNNISGSDQGDGSSFGGEELLFASRDPFVNATQSFGAYLTRPRGQRGQNEPEINGIPVTNARTGFFSWTSQLGNLNDVFRGRDVRYGLEPSPYTFGGINGSTYIQSTAADQQKGVRVSYTAQEQTYKNRVMLTASTGLMKNGWAWTFSGDRRWSEHGYIPGTFMDGYAYYGAVSKVIGKHQFDLTTFGSPLKQNHGVMATQECYDLSGNHYYNPDWGYQTSNGQKVERASNISNIFQPVTILDYEYKPSEKTRWTTSVGYQVGKDKFSSLDWYNASSPYGNYYQNLPSYYYTKFPPDSITGNQVKQQIMQNPNLLQIDWDRLYQANYLNKQTVYDVNGIPGNNYTGLQSVYVMADRVNELKKYTFNTNIEHNINKNATIYGGLTFYSQDLHSYKQLTDLMGGDYFVNYNQFASLQYVSNPLFQQNNLNDPNAIIKVGDKYGYDYSIRTNNTTGWGQLVYNLNKLDLFAAAEVGDNSFYRDGFMRNGLFANNSYGKSATHNFFTYAVKGGVTYKIKSSNYLFVNAAYIGTPPASANTYISSDTRDFTVANPTIQKNTSIEGGYLLRASKMSARVVGYINDVKDATEIKRFYDDDPAYRTFVNYAMQHENSRSIGSELMLDYRLTRALTVTGIASICQAYYTNNPDINVYLDNDTVQHANTAKAYINNYHLATGPQSIYSLRFSYRTKSYWSARINFDYLENNYVDINPNRRTQQAVDLVPVGSAQWHQILDQEKLPSAFVVDLHVDKTFQLSRTFDFVKNATGSNTTLYLSMGINNLLNNTDLILRGREQFRYDFSYRNPEKFANVYQYAYGITYYLMVSLKF